VVCAERRAGRGEEDAPQFLACRRAPSIRMPGRRVAGGARGPARSGCGQPGHPKHDRALIPNGPVPGRRPAQARGMSAGAGRRCSAPIRNRCGTRSGMFPEIRPLVTEYQLHRLTCPCCRASTCAPLPPGVPMSQGGPRLVALVALLMGCFRQSKRRVTLFLGSVLDQPCSPGWVVKLQQQGDDPRLRPRTRDSRAGCRPRTSWAIDESPTKQCEANGLVVDLRRTPPIPYSLCGPRGRRPSSRSC